MKLNAYLLLGDPAYLAASVASYYDLVDRIVVSYDDSHTSWAGDPLPIDKCFAELKDNDPLSKFDLLPGRYSRPAEPPIESDTLQRRAAFAKAAEGADWVIQLDSDEVIPNPSVFVGMIERAAAAGASALDYPSRWLYARLPDGSYLEGSSRLWQPVAAYPGPLAVRPTVTLTNARQCDGALYRVDFQTKNTDPWRYGHNTPVHSVIPVEKGVLHFSWVRTEDELIRKSQMSGHSDLTWRINEWRSAQRHPRLRVATTPLRRRGELHPRWLRRTCLPIDPPARFVST